jgi:hypothetical protein
MENRCKSPCIPLYFWHMELKLAGSIAYTDKKVNPVRDRSTLWVLAISNGINPAPFGNWGFVPNYLINQTLLVIIP